jgi:hypothetical protein
MPTALARRMASRDPVLSRAATAPSRQARESAAASPAGRQPAPDMAAGVRCSTRTRARDREAWNGVLRGSGGMGKRRWGELNALEHRNGLLAGGSDGCWVYVSMTGRDLGPGLE